MSATGNDTFSDTLYRASCMRLLFCHPHPPSASSTMFSRPLTADLVIFWRRFRFAVAIDERIRHCCVLVASIHGIVSNHPTLLCILIPLRAFQVLVCLTRAYFLHIYLYFCLSRLGHPVCTVPVRRALSILIFIITHPLLKYLIPIPKIVVFYVQ